MIRMINVDRSRKHIQHIENIDKIKLLFANAFAARQQIVLLFLLGFFCFKLTTFIIYLSYFVGVCFLCRLCTKQLKTNIRSNISYYSCWCVCVCVHWYIYITMCWLCCNIETLSCDSLINLFFFLAFRLGDYLNVYTHTCTLSIGLKNITL